MKQIVLLFFFLISIYSVAQQTEIVDFKTADVAISINPHQKTIAGKVVYTFDVLKKTNSIFLDVRKGVHPYTILLNQKEIEYYVENEKLWLLNDFQPSQLNILDILYECSPKQTVYFIGWDNAGVNQVWTQGQGKYTSRWLPSLDDVNDKIIFDLSLTFHKDYQVLANGKLTSKEKVNDSLVKWQYQMEKPMSSYLVSFAAGKYKNETVQSQSGKNLSHYYYPNEGQKVEPTYRYSKQIFDFLEAEIGVAYPWQNYKQIPVKDFLYAGMENTGCTIFSDSFIIDEIAFIDKNYVNVNAHELAHQWFGNLVTATSSTHHWLQEGFATYYALLAEKEMFGNDYYYYKLYESALQLKNQEQTKLLNPKASSLVFYQKGAWVLHRLRELIGDVVFQKSVQQYLQQNQYKSVATANFMNIVNQNTTVNLSAFESTWFHNEKFPFDEVKQSLQKNKVLKKILKHPTKFCLKESTFLQREVLYNIAKDSNITQSEKIKVYQKAFKSTVKVRQVLSEVIEEIPVELKTEFKSLLKDKSYQTIENALFKLWVQYPIERKYYLNQTKNIVGFNDKNVKTMWLALSLLTKDYENNLKSERLQELISYTSPVYHFEVRKIAFEYLKLIRFTNDEVLTNLEEAMTHHNWRFKKFAVNLRKELNK